MGIIGAIGAVIHWIFNDDDEFTRNLPEVSYHNFIADDRVFRSKFFRPSKKYVQDLQYCYLQLRNDYGEKHLFDADTMKAQYQELFIKTCELERLHASAQTNEQIYKDQAKLALDWNSNTGKKNVVREQHGLDPVEAKEQPRKGHLFSSKDGISKLTKIKYCAAMVEYGFIKSDIAEYLGISESTIGQYLSIAKPHYKKGKFKDRDYLKFDVEYGNENWYLDDVFKDMWEYVDEKGNPVNTETESTLPDSEQGVIHHGLQNPVISA